MITNGIGEKEVHKEGGEKKGTEERSRPLGMFGLFVCRQACPLNCRSSPRFLLPNAKVQTTSSKPQGRESSSTAALTRLMNAVHGESHR